MLYVYYVDWFVSCLVGISLLVDNWKQVFEVYKCMSQNELFLYCVLVFWFVNEMGLLVVMLFLGVVNEFVFSGGKVVKVLIEVDFVVGDSLIFVVLDLLCGWQVVMVLMVQLMC